MVVGGAVRMGFVPLGVLVFVFLSQLWNCGAGKREFIIKDDKFVKDGETLQIISGSIHYQRIHPAYWRDRLERVKSMGLNAVQFYVPWNFHERLPGVYEWTGFADVEGFLALCQEMDLLVLLRPGPYICGEWDAGGLPWWLSSSRVMGGGTMRLRAYDPDYLAHVTRWWRVLLPRMKPFLYQHGGPIVLVQIENEYGFCDNSPDLPYLTVLRDLAAEILGDDTILYTTDPPYVVEKGSLWGKQVYSVVDFGPGTDLEYAFKAQAGMNILGKSPPFCSEYYTGWLTHWGEVMANTSTPLLLKTLQDILEYANGTGSVNFYMAHGGTNFGYWAGANIANTIYQPHITSYDYDCPVGEAGGYGQPGIGGDNKFEAIRKVISAHTGVEPPAPPPPPVAKAYGKVVLDQSVGLLDSLPHLFPGDGIMSELPGIMEDYGQWGGLILYRTWVPAVSLNGQAVLDLGEAVHDYARVFLDGKLVGTLERSNPQNLTLPAVFCKGAEKVVLDILVEVLGRVNFGCPSWDFKGLNSKYVKIDGTVLHPWRVFPLPLDDLDKIPFGEPGISQARGSQQRSQCSHDAHEGNTAFSAANSGGVFFRGVITIDESARLASGHLPDTYLSVKGWGKGLAWINGFNLGWYWPTHGPQETQYIPGPLLKAGDNELVMVELEKVPAVAAVHLVAQPDFYGPHASVVPAAASGVIAKSHGPARPSQSPAAGQHVGQSPACPAHGFHGPRCEPWPTTLHDPMAMPSPADVRWADIDGDRQEPVDVNAVGRVNVRATVVGQSSASASSSATATPGAHAGASSASSTPGHSAASASSDPPSSPEPSISVS